jgi:hypothetical protein
MTTQPTGPAEPAAPSNALSILAGVAGAFALIIPIVFGPAGVILGVMARSRRERLANVGLLLAALGMAIGLTVTFLVAGNR